ncbi:hypothetical protein F751_1870 [Auxenochlorella protothecoides]|uniref:GDT1 family protein n=1 Tax=Auxenochlorella protothecoides TaxID=3075 RepID=A0A087SGY7_AUXPR|nr:hypothetical protein F751_1870 [Auxenochlorella protothecoides]KFM24991.1 hypothetical protein F751_1870 [Auxenochlorella protothecoides]
MLYEVSTHVAGVVLGALAGHGAASGLAILGGSALGGVANPRTVQIVSGVLFLGFAASTAFDIATGAHASIL